MTMIPFDSQVNVLPHRMGERTQGQIKNEPMLFSCDCETAAYLGGPLTRDFLFLLP